MDENHEGGQTQSLIEHFRHPSYIWHVHHENMQGKRKRRLQDELEKVIAHGQERHGDT